MSFLAKKKIFVWVSLLSLVLQLTSSIFLYSPVYSQEPSPIPTPTDGLSSPTPTPTETPAASPEPTPSPSATPEITPSPTPDVSPTPEPSVTPSPSLEPTPTPTPEVIPTPDATVSPNNQSEAPPEVRGEQTQSTPSPESAPEPTVTPTPQPSENGKLFAAILKDTKADSIDELDLDFKTESSPAIKTDKLDYAPTDTVLVSGTGFVPNKTYTIYITSSDEPAVSHQDSVTADEKGNLFYSYQLDGNYRPNYRVEIKDGERLVAETSFTDSQEDYKHWKDKSGGDWINGALQDSNSSYFEGEIVPHYWKSQNLTIGHTYAFNIYYDYYDTSGGGYCGFDYLGQYNTNRTTTFLGANPAADNGLPEGHGNFYTVGADIISVSSPVSSGVQRYIQVKFTATAAKAEFYWGFHLSTPGAISSCQGSKSWPGASLQSDVRDTPAYDTATMLGGGGSLQINPNKAITRGTISGYKWNDENNNGVYDNEPKLSGWTIDLCSDSNCNTVLQSTTTDGSGNYSFSVNAGIYYVGEVQQTGWTKTHPTTNSYGPLTISESTSTFSNQNFGNYQVPLTGTIELKKVWSGTGGQTTLKIGSTIGGNEVANQLTGTNGGSPLTTGTNTVNTGTYYVSESGGLNNYSSSLSCTKNGSNYTLGISNSLTVGSGDIFICTFTNTRNTGTIELKKLWIGDGGQTTLKIGSTVGGSDVANEPTGASGGAPLTTGAKPVNTGTYYVSETGGLSNYFSALSCTKNGNDYTPGQSGDVAVGNGDAVVCTFTNTIKSWVTVTKFDDRNGSGTRESAFEPLLSNWEFKLYNGHGCTGTAINTQTTDGSGTIVFSGLNSDTDYSVKETQKTGWESTTGGLCQDTHVGSGTGTQLDFGNFQEGTLGGYKFNDVNGDGSYGAGDSFLSGWTFKLEEKINGVWTEVDSSTTGLDGVWTFTGIGNGAFRVHEVGQTGWTPTTYTSGYYPDVNGFSSTSGMDITNIYFGNQGKGHIVVDKTTLPSGDQQSFSFTTSGTGYSGFSLTDASTPNDQELVAGTYSVAETPVSGWSLTETTCVSSKQDTETAGNLKLDAGETITCTFANTKHGTFIVNKVTDPSNDTTTEFTVTATGNGTILSNATQTVKNGGHIDYEVMPGTYSASESNLPAGWQQYTNSCSDIIVAAGQSYACWIHNTKLGSISGYKYDTTTGLGLASWTISWYDPNGHTGNSTTTDSTGYYSFANLWPGLYQLSETLKDGWTQTGSPSDVQLAAAQNSTGNNFYNFQKISVTACKKVDADGSLTTTSDQTNKFGWTVSLLKNGQTFDTKTTGENGCYAWNDLGPGTYGVSEEVPGGWTALTETSHNFGTAQSGQDKTFTFINFNNGQISGDKYNDINGDGNQDEGEPGLSGWTIYLDTNNNGQLDQGEPSQVTDENGHYLFSNLGPGTYHVREVEQNGWTQTEPGGDGSYIVEMTSNGNKIQRDFGNQGQGRITVNKNVDTNGDNQVDVFGATDWTWDIANGEQNIQTGQGRNLPAGPYTISEDQKTDYHVSELSCGETNYGAIESQRITLNPGEELNCTFTNTRDTGSLTVNKKVDTDGDFIYEGGNDEANSLGFKWGTESGSLNRTMGDEVSGLPTGSYNVYETDNIQGYEFMGWFEGKGVCEESELITSLPAQVSINKDVPTVLTFCNKRETGTIEVRKVVEPADESLWNITLDGNERNELIGTIGNDESVRRTVVTGGYAIVEGASEGTNGDGYTSSFTCTGGEEIPGSGDGREIGVFLNKGEHIICTFTNTFVTPILTISKFNDATGDRHPGDSVLYTLTVKATKNFLRNVQLTDVLPEGFKYRGGSCTAESTVRGTLSCAPTYASPGVWDLGNMVKDEVVTLTYIADIDGSQNPGLYKDLAWAVGDSLREASEPIFALAADPGKVSDNFVGTQVNVVRDQQSGASYNGEQKVLGASTSMPATGADSRWLILAGILFVLGWNVLLAGLILRRKNA